jgi:hypothetical protein
MNPVVVILKAPPMISLIVVLLVLGLIVYLVRLAPIDQMFKNAIVAVVCVFAIIWLLRSLGLIDSQVMGRGFGW